MLSHRSWIMLCVSRGSRPPLAPEGRLSETAASRWLHALVLPTSSRSSKKSVFLIFHPDSCRTVSASRTNCQSKKDHHYPCAFASFLRIKFDGKVIRG